MNDGEQDEGFTQGKLATASSKPPVRHRLQKSYVAHWCVSSQCTRELKFCSNMNIWLILSAFYPREMMVRAFYIKEKVGWWATKVVLLIKAVVHVRSEPATLGPIPQGAQNQCGGREQHSSFPLMLLILIYLQPGAHPPLAARVQRCSKGKKSVSVGKWACSLQKLFLNMTELLNLLYLFIKNNNIPDRSPALVQLSSTMAAVNIRTVYFCTTRLPEALLPASVCQTQKWQIIHYSSSSLSGVGMK